MVADHEKEWFNDESKNAFNNNTYIMPRGDRPYFVVKNGRRQLSELTAHAQEKQVRIQIAARKPLKLECPLIP